MRGVIVFVSGLFILTAITMFAGMILEPILAQVVDAEAVQALGWGETGEDITDTIVRWLPLLYITYLLVWAGAWYFRQERMTARR